MKLNGQIIKVNDIQETDIDAMFDLMNLYFEGMSRDVFEIDLYEKQWIIILRDCITEEIKGFSTQMIMDKTMEGIPYKIVFSGDTIIHKDYWGELELMRIFSKLIFYLIKRYRGIKLYWFLISMGYKTYRFLPVFFKDFYPRYDKEIPEHEKKLLDALGYQKYPKEYDNKLGVIKPSNTEVSLRKGVADISERLLKNPHIYYFTKKNPLHYKGYELACIAELTMENLKPTAYKVIMSSKQSHDAIFQANTIC